jgi:hypothetical protein
MSRGPAGDMPMPSGPTAWNASSTASWSGNRSSHGSPCSTSADVATPSAPLSESGHHQSPRSSPRCNWPMVRRRSQLYSFTRCGAARTGSSRGRTHQSPGGRFVAALSKTGHLGPSRWLLRVLPELHDVDEASRRDAVEAVTPLLEPRLTEQARAGLDDLSHSLGFPSGHGSQYSLNVLSEHPCRRRLRGTTEPTAADECVGRGPGRR